MKFYNRQDNEKKAWPGLNTIAKALSLSCSTVRRAIWDLEKGRTDTKRAALL